MYNPNIRLGVMRLRLTLKEARIVRGYTVEELSQKLGVDYASIEKAGLEDMSLDLALKLAEILNMRIGDLR